MQYILNKRFDGTFTMNWVGTEISTAQRDIKTFLSDPTLGIKSITKFNDNIRIFALDILYKIHINNEYKRNIFTAYK